MKAVSLFDGQVYPIMNKNQIDKGEHVYVLNRRVKTVEDGFRFMTYEVNRQYYTGYYTTKDNPCIDSKIDLSSEIEQMSIYDIVEV